MASRIIIGAIEMMMLVEGGRNTTVIINAIDKQ
jgi:hypothetical protein